MESSSEVIEMLTEIRDLQKQHLEEYSTYTSRALELQETAVRRQAEISHLYRKVVVVFGIVTAGLIAYLYFSTTQLPQ